VLNFLMKLDRRAGRWLNVMDDELQEPITRVITAAVFVGAPARTNGHVKGGIVDTQEEVAQQKQVPQESAVSQPDPECKKHIIVSSDHQAKSRMVAGP
jgi:hypothetical protein